MKHHPLLALGFLTVVAYGAWFYGFGVLLDEILRVTGWSETSVVAVSSVSALVAGGGAILAGRILDRLGSRVVFLVGVVGSSILAGAAWADTLAGFAAAGIIGGGLIGATGHYHTTLGTAAGLHITRPARAIAIVTLYGAFASTIMLPLGGLITDAAGWRPALFTYGVLSAVGFVWAAFVADVRPSSDRSEPLRWSPLVVMVLVSSLFGSAGYGTVGVYQVPIMVSLGLALPLAASLAGLRGVAQFLGRLPIDPIVGRLGSRKALVWANVLVAVGTVLLLWSGNPLVAGAYALVAGVGIGAFSPLTGILAFEAAGARRVGTLMGMQAAAAGIGIAVGPYLAASVVSTSGDRRAAVPVAVVMSLLAAGALLWRHPAPD